MIVNYSFDKNHNSASVRNVVPFQSLVLCISAVSDVHFGHFSYALDEAIDSATTLHYHIL